MNEAVIEATLRTTNGATRRTALQAPLRADAAGQRRPPGRRRSAGWQKPGPLRLHPRSAAVYP